MPNRPEADSRNVDTASKLPSHGEESAAPRVRVSPSGSVRYFRPVIVPNSAGGTEAVQRAFGEVEDVTSVAVESVGRL